MSEAQDRRTDQYISLVLSNNVNSYCCQYSHGNNVIKDYCLAMTLKKKRKHSLELYPSESCLKKKNLPWKGLPAVLNSIGFRGNSIELYYISIDLIPAHSYGIIFFSVRTYVRDIMSYLYMHSHSAVFILILFVGYHKQKLCSCGLVSLSHMGSCALSWSSVTTDLAALCRN